jgi:tetratricopeptide (TPR) repeat protein
MKFYDFEINLARAVLQARPNDIPALEILGNALRRKGDLVQALEIDRKVASLRPKDPQSYYNLARTFSNLKQMDRAFESLEKAFELGYRDYKHLLRDRDLENVRRDPRFQRFMNKRWGRRQPQK